MGYYYEPKFYVRVEDQHNEIILEDESKPSIAMSEDTAYIMNKLLLHPVYGSEGTGIKVQPYITKKFFNYDNNYEVMVFVYANTADYKGKYVLYGKDNNHRQPHI